MLPRGCCCCCKDENEMAPRERFAEEGASFGCADFCAYSRMSEGRQSQVVLLDERRLDILIKPKLYAGELLDMVASHFSLKEKEYFGLAYLDDTGHYSWLQLDRRVLEHEFPKRSAQSTLVLYFRIKYFVESITHLRDSSTVEAFYLQTQSLVYNGVIQASSDKAFQLAALVLQATHGDYTSDTLAKQQLKKLPVLPTSTLDKSGLPWWLGISYKGICQYDLTDRKVPRKLFLWKQLENLYFRDRKFSIEVYDPKRVSASRKTFGSGNISVSVWFASSPSLTKCIWSMAISQHQFYLDRKHTKGAPSPSRHLSDIADELSHGSYSTETSSLGRSVSSLSLPALKLDSDSCDETLDTVEMFVALKARKEALEKALRKKCEELKKICLREGELTGSLPPEMPLSLGEQIPVVKRRAGRPPQDCHLWRKKTKDEEELARLELEYEIQTKIVSAAHKLLSDSSLKKNIRRQRKLSHQKAVAKLKEIEQKLVHFRKKEFLSSENVYHSKTEQLIQSASANLKDLSITFSPTENKKEGAKNTFNKMTSSTSSPVPLSSSSVPSSPSNSRHLPLKPPDLLQGYTPSSVYQTQTTYRSQQYPTFSMRSPSTHSSTGSECGGPLIAPYKNKFESTLDLDGSNLYSVPTQRTSQAFDTQDDILASIPTPPQDLGLVSRHNSLDRNRRHSFQKYRRYLENSGMFQEPQRPGSAQPHAAYDNYAMYKGMFPYQEQQPYVSAYSFHHPHHYHHHRHQGVKSPGQQEGPDTNLYQKNLKLYAADAMHLGKQFRKSPTSPPEKLWPETPESKTPRGSYVTGLLSPSSGSERSWTMEGTSSEARVPTSVSADGLKSHVDIVTYGHFQPYWEETKPYETSDFYKYSTKHRKQHQAASQNLQAKLLAWKASQSAGVSAAMSPVLERSRTSSPAVAEDKEVPSEKPKQEGSSDQSTSKKKERKQPWYDISKLPLTANKMTNSCQQIPFTSLKNS
ncbi:FERM domain-containing protein 4B [Trichonephila inaurata madagascariensis]|uniref:FERM domain-containing protein 4B n=1 Tax=Trichonephila inaurata madagascariensis TaxID=2747483 RepID=A0A8X6XTN0_9ARAC|nr:FERM domain-containing protein 4B [Trichonephila inaurata madagascariensis]